MTLKVYPQLKWKRPESAALSALEGSRNCTCAGGAALANWWLSNDAANKGEPEPRLITHHDFRMAAGNPMVDGKPRGLASSEALRALTLFGVPATRYYGESYVIARDALKAGAAVGCCIHYPTINKGWPELSGQLNFNGEHFLVLSGYTPDDDNLGGKNTTTSNDSLYDGRTRTWGTAPLGPQLAPFGAYRAAMGDFLVGLPGARKPIGDDLGVFIIVQPAPTLPPPETDAEKIARLEAELAACKEANP